MGPNPLLPSEVGALADQLFFPLTAWAAELIYRLDDAVLATWASEAAADKPGPPSTTVGVPIHDNAGIAAMFKGGGARRRALKAGP